VESDPDYIRHVVRAVYFHIAQLVAQQGPVKICASNVHEAPIRLPRIDCAYVMIGIEFPPLLEVEPTSKIDQFFSLERIAAMSLSYELLKKIGGLLSVTTVNHLSSVQLYLPAIRS
jgi:hypothetical protein